MTENTIRKPKHPAIVYLRQYAAMKLRRDDLKEELLMIRQNATRATSRYTAERMSGTGRKDGMANAAVKAVEVEERLKRVISKLGFDHTEALLLLHRADVSAQAESHRAERIAHSNALLDTLAKLRAADECLTIQKLAVTGNDLINLGVPQGKRIGILLRTLLEQVIDGIIPNEPAALLNAAEQYLNQQKSG